MICNYDENKIINVGSQKEISIIELAELIKRIVGYKGNIIFDSSKPDGVMQKLMNSNKINKLGWKPKIPLDKGIRITYHNSFKI